jgi:hypothetical protein
MLLGTPVSAVLGAMAAEKTAPAIRLLNADVMKLQEYIAQRV